jgi:hypothetical protein
MRLAKTPAQYLATRDGRHELAYEAMLSAGRTQWTVGQRVRVYRTTRGARMLPDRSDGDADDLADDPRDYDAEHYIRVLREQFATRLSRALAPEHFAAVFADPDQLSLFATPLDDAHPILTITTP